jgi:TIR domain
VWLFRWKPGDEQKSSAANRPKKWFISHKYGDSAVPDMLGRIPHGIEPIVFPPIRVPPEKLISNNLIKAILACDGLIYPTGSVSDDSPWVALERDYALRAGKQVFKYDAVTQLIDQDTSLPMHLPAFPSYSSLEYKRVKAVLRFMREERYFAVPMDRRRLQAGMLWPDELRRPLVERLQAGGYAVVFLSRRGIMSEWVKAEYKSALDQFPQQILPALLEPIDLPLDLARFQSVQLYGDKVQSATHRMDDLIVRLYWLIYRHQHQGETALSAE